MLEDNEKTLDKVYTWITALFRGELHEMNASFREELYEWNWIELNWTWIALHIIVLYIDWNQIANMQVS